MNLIKNISSEQWQEWSLQAEPTEFQQAPEWAKIQGGSICRLAVVEDGLFIVGVQAVLKSVMGFKYWWASRGPIFAAGVDQAKQQAALGQLYEGLLQNAAQATFWRLEPAVGGFTLANNIKLVPSIALNPKLTLRLDLSESLEELLKKMHQKTRYNIRLAEKKGVSARAGDKNDFDKFWRLMLETKNRDGFRLHNQEHYRRMINSGLVRLWLAEQQAEILATGLFAYHGKTVTYVHGASSDASRELMAPYLLHWRVIQDAQANGCLIYDFHGVDKLKWPGVTRFKTGFGGAEMSYPGTFDLVVNKGYYGLYKILRGIRRIMTNFK